MNKYLFSLLVLGILVAPVLACAQIGGPVPSVTTDLTGLGQKIANAVWIVFTIIAVVAFVIAGILFLVSGGNPDKIAQARTAFIWGVAGVVVGILAFTMIRVVESVL